MKSTLLSFTLLGALAAVPALAQQVPVGPGKVVTGPAGLPSVEPYTTRASNINGATAMSSIAPALPTVDLGPNATPTDYLQAAHDALAARQTGKAQSALEHAETLLLTRSVTAGNENVPDQGPAIRNIQGALQALASNDIQGSMRLVRDTMPLTSGMHRNL